MKNTSVQINHFNRKCELTTIQINYEAEKLRAISSFTKADMPPIEDVLLSQIDRLYRQRVPKTVRQFLDGRAGAASSIGKNKTETTYKGPENDERR